MKNINEFIEELLCDKIDLKDYCNHLEDGMEYFEENFEGYLNSNKLSNLIGKSYKNKDLQFILSGLLYCSSKESITDEIFNKLLKFPKDMRKTNFIALGHCDISFYQLMKINKMKIGFEAFGQLMHHMYASDVFSTEDIIQLLKDSEYIKSIWSDTFNQLLSSDIISTPTKKELLEQYI